jgi:hypothetical protein
MTVRAIGGRRPPLDLEPLSLGRRAMYRRVLALVSAQDRPYVVGGALGLSLQLGQLIDGELELYFNADDVPVVLTGVEGAGLKVEVDDDHGRARITYGDHRAVIRWALPTPLFGEIDPAWFDHARRTRFLGLRVRVAPVEELLWLRVAVPSAASVGDPLIGQLLLGRGENLDWGRLLMRMAGLEALLLAHLFLFWHQYPESARTIIPVWVVTALRGRLDQAEHAADGLAEISVLDPGRIEESLAEQSLHGGGG